MPLSATAESHPYGQLQPFTTDACTMFPDGTPEDPKKWQHCCILHDLKYWAGGTETERLQADEDLWACVALTGEPEVADVMFLGVRVGGTPYLPTAWRWGYGWEYVRGNSPLTATEKEDVARLTPPNPLEVKVEKIANSELVI